MQPLRPWPLAVRDADGRALGELLERATSGRPELVLVVGEAGSGKSHALTEIAAASHLGAMTVHLVHARADAELGTVDELIAQVERAPSPRAGGRPQQLRTALEETVAAGPAAILIDDLDSADDGSVIAITETVAACSDLPLLWAVCTRSESDLRLGELITAAAGREPLTLRMVPLQPSDVAAAIEMTGMAPVDPDFADACAELTGGNPGFLNDILDELDWHGIAPVRESLPALAHLIPEKTVRAIQARLSHLPAKAAALADAVHILGEQAAGTRAGRLAGVEPDAFPVLVDQLSDAAILARREPLHHRCPVVARVLEGTPATRDRGAMRGRAADLLRADGVPLGVIARHVHLAMPGTDPGACETLLASARDAIEKGRLTDAEHDLRRLAAEPPGQPLVEQGALLLASVQAVLDRPGGRDRFDSLLARVEPAEQRTEALQRFGDLLLVDGQRQAAVEVFERAAAELDGGEHPVLQGEIEARLAWAWTQLPGGQERVRALLERDTCPSTSGLVPAARGLASAYAGKPRAAALTALDAQRAAGPPDGPLAPDLAAASVSVLIVCDELSAARRACEGHLSRVGDSPLFEAAIRSQQAVVCLAEGELRAATEAADAAIAVLGNADHPLCVSGTVAGALAELELSGPAAATTRLARADNGDAREAVDSLVLAARGWIELARGRAHAALDWFSAAERLSDAVGILNPGVNGAPIGMAFALRRTGATDDAAERAAAALEQAREHGAPRTIAAALRASAACTPRARALRSLGEALELLEGSAAKLDRARTLLMYGTFLHRANRLGAARAPLGEALDLAAKMDAGKIRERALSELRAVGARPRRDRLHGVEALTAAEWQVADHVAQGLSNNEVAAALVVTPKTIEWHLRNVFSKLDIHDRRALRGLMGGTSSRTASRRFGREEWSATVRR